MSIEAINAQLLRAVGVGVALFDARTNVLTFQNDVFSSWFNELDSGAQISEIFEQVDPDSLASALDAHGKFTHETSFRRRRRTLVLSLVFTRAEIGHEQVIVLECQNITKIRELEAMLESYSTMVERNTREIQREKERAERLLLNVMPKAVYEEYTTSGDVAPHRFESVSVLSLDFVDFTKIIDSLSPDVFVNELGEITTAFDQLGQQFQCERLRTAGDTYMCIAGMEESHTDHLRSTIEAAQRFVQFLRRRNEKASIPWICRIGLGSGPVLGTLLGSGRYVYDVFGVAVQDAFDARRCALGFETLLSAELAGSVPDLRSVVPSLNIAREQGYVALPATRRSTS